MKPFTVLVLGLLAAGLFHPASADTRPTRLGTRPVALAENLPNGDRVGRLRILGMLELPNFKIDGRRFSQLSGLAWDDDDGILYALSDKGMLFHLRPVIENEKLVGVDLLKAVPLLEPNSDKPLTGRRADSEGLDILNGRNGRPGDAELVISFERFPRIVRYHPDGHAVSEYLLPAPLHDGKAYRNPNLMLESVCVDDTLGILTAPEAPLKNERPGYTRLFSLTGQSWFYPLTEPNRISSLECLGQRRVLVLERDFGRPFRHITVSLKLTTLPPMPSATEVLTTETVVTLDDNDGFQIDNFEGLARHRENRFFAVSDDNDLFIQRTLLLYFEILTD
jgi:hypothetical protein